MSLYDVARTLVNDYTRSQAGKLWQSYLLSAKLRDLRARLGLTQAEVAKRSGISESTIRNYEQQKSTPKQPHLEALAHAFDIRAEALKLYDIDLMPANALFQLGDTYGLAPRYDKKFAILEPTTSYMREFLSAWAEQYASLKSESLTRSEYEQWKDEFFSSFDPSEFPLRYRETEHGFELIEPWQKVQFSQALQRLRKKNGQTQEELGIRSGITKATIRSYEQRKRLPQSAQLEALALTLKVTEGALIFFDFGSPVQASHALFQIANQYGLIPDFVDGQAVLRTIQPGLERYIDQWAYALDGNYESAEPYGADTYQEWKDRYKPDGLSGTDWKSRYRLYFDSTGRLTNAAESDNDPFNPKYDEQGGFLRA